MTKRILLTLMAFCMALALPSVAFAAEAIGGTCGDDATWTYINGTLTISGNGAMQDYDINGGPWRLYNWPNSPEIKTVVIKDGITSIGNGAFSYCGDLTSVTIPSSITSIGDEAFFNCDSLTSITLPNSVTSIGDEAFKACFNLTSVAIPNSVTRIGAAAFAECERLPSVVIPNSVTSIGMGAFSYCGDLTNVTIPNSVTRIEVGVLFSCENLTAIQVDSGNQNYVSVDGVLFSKDTKSLIEYPGGKQGPYTIPNSVTSIGEYAFGGCEGLTSVTIPNSVTSIGAYAFGGCEGLTSVTIPNSVTSIGEYAFGECKGLTNVVIPDSVTSIGEYAFGWCEGLTSVNIPSSVTSVGEGAFKSCNGLTSVTIPSNVTNVGRGAFGGCTRLTTIQVEAGNRNYISVDGVLFTKDKRTLIAYPGAKRGSYTIPDSVTSIGEYAFGWCEDLTSVTIPNSVTTFEEGAFWDCNNLNNVTIPNGVTSIGVCAFSFCGKLTSVTIPISVISIEYGVFNQCAALTDVYYTGTKEQWEAISINKYSDIPESATIHYNSIAPAEPQQPAKFADVPSGQWYSEAVAWAVEQGITTGTGATTFSPNKTCTNAEIITFLYRANNSPKVSTILPFTPKNSWATDALKWAYSEGIIGADFDEQTPCTRYTTVEYFWKAFDKPKAQTEAKFSDIGSYNDSPIAWAVQNGIVYGTSATTFSPDVTCDRATIVTLLQRAYGK